MDDCIFCKIQNGETPCYKIYEDDKFLGFLDINPLNPGNSLLIPKKHYRWVIDVPEFGQYWEVAKKIAIASQAGLSAMSVSFLTLGFEVPHAHIRIIPRFSEDRPRFDDGINTKDVIAIPPDQMVTISQKIKTCL